MEILIIKYFHVISASLMFGTGLGSVFYKWRSDRSGDLRAIAETNRNVVVADWMFTTPTVLLQPISGIYLAHLNAYSLTASWLLLSLFLFIVAGLCWLPVLYLQIRMRNISIHSVENNLALPAHYHRLNKRWALLGLPAFVAVLTIYALMLAKPDIGISL